MKSNISPLEEPIYREELILHSTRPLISFYVKKRKRRSRSAWARSLSLEKVEIRVSVLGLSLARSWAKKRKEGKQRSLRVS